MNECLNYLLVLESGFNPDSSPEALLPGASVFKCPSTVCMLSFLPVTRTLSLVLGPTWWALLQLNQDDVILRALIISAKIPFSNKVTFIGTGWIYILGATIQPAIIAKHMLENIFMYD